MLITLVTYYCLNISERPKRIGDLYRDLIGHFYVIGGSDWRSLFWGSEPTLCISYHAGLAPTYSKRDDIKNSSWYLGQLVTKFWENEWDTDIRKLSVSRILRACVIFLCLCCTKQSLNPPGASSSSSSSSLSNTVFILFFLGRDSPIPLWGVRSLSFISRDGEGP